ncbi:RHS repeat domain-containing protein [Aliikangiella sp. G2MR2-5]|uniref:RHS repeat domain-containing protein n=1 Tax=Aliikangiella sp. G2MR2-5 TaxID=2788943 RepID=UPI0018A95861|nr:RHS repeat domain-containing protein [Aliikangiella sp. G2MR2-5]
MMTLSLRAIGLVALFSSTTILASSSTSYQYDARGRLVQVKNSANEEINYTYDKAGNRSAVTNGGAVETPEPIISSFSVPSSVASAGDWATVSWVSQNAISCELARNGSTNGYTDLPTSGSRSFRVFESMIVKITCVNGSKSAFQSKMIRISSGGFNLR